MIVPLEVALIVSLFGAAMNVGYAVRFKTSVKRRYRLGIGLVVLTGAGFYGAAILGYVPPVEMGMRYFRWFYLALVVAISCDPWIDSMVERGRVRGNER